MDGEDNRICIMPGMAMPVRTLSCSRGHSWDIPYGAPEDVITVFGEHFCLRCILEYLRQHAGTVTAVE